ncbi:Protein of unknown function [Bacillus mobilis]|nr:Protein of unknown function [Bacillus mobilis]
MDVWLSA